MEDSSAPGWPGLPARWTPSDKSGVGTSLSSRVWFTLGHGILEEVYNPEPDQAATRDLGLLVSDGRGFFSEEKRHTRHEIAYVEEGVPAYCLTNTCERGRYRTRKEVVADPRRDVLLQRVRFEPLEGELSDYHLYVLLAPHLGNHGSGNTAWVADFKGTPMLFAERGGHSLALASSEPWLGRSAGFVGFSDGWQDVSRHGRMEWRYTRAENGNVALTGEVDLGPCGGELVLALGFGYRPADAAFHALQSLQDGFDAALDEYVRAWRSWQGSLEELDRPAPNPYRISTAVLHVHEARQFRGASIASLSIPWGESRGDDDLGGYHLVWVRDMAEAVAGLLAAGAHDNVRRVLRYLQATQEPDGYWPQNMWLDGTAYWGGIQMDETAFPLLLADTARREGRLDGDELERLWPMVRRAAGYVLRNGPVTQQDRWEEDSGYSPFTIAVEVAGLLAAADLAEVVGEHGLATYMRETADYWNASIERWIYASGTELAQRVGVEGYYVRIAPDFPGQAGLDEERVRVANRPMGQSTLRAASLVSTDALALVRFGLRSAEDPRIVNTVKVIDALLKTDTPCGPIWHRYNDDGYGEQADGSPFDGTGIGRGWPLLTGERAHYELAAGHREEAERLLCAMEAFAGVGGLIPEQVWDSADIPEKGLYLGRPSGSAMPLVWAHAEHVKLCRSLRDGRVFDTPPQTVQRYVVEKRGTPYAAWRFNHRVGRMPAGKVLRIEVLSPAVVHWSADGWRTVRDSETRDTGLGVHLVDLPTAQLGPSGSVVFTFYWPGACHWEGRDFAVEVSE